MIRHVNIFQLHTCNKKPRWSWFFPPQISLFHSFFATRFVCVFLLTAAGEKKRGGCWCRAHHADFFFFVSGAPSLTSGGLTLLTFGGEDRRTETKRKEGCDWTSAAPCPPMWRALSCQKKKNGGSLSHKGIRSAGVSAFKLLAPSYTKCNSKKPKDIDCREQFKYDFLIAINMYALNRSTPLSSLWYYEKNVPSGA